MILLLPLLLGLVMRGVLVMGASLQRGPSCLRQPRVQERLARPARSTASRVQLAAAAPGRARRLGLHQQQQLQTQQTQQTQ